MLFSLVAFLTALAGMGLLYFSNKKPAVCVFAGRSRFQVRRLYFPRRFPGDLVTNHDCCRSHIYLGSSAGGAVRHCACYDVI